MVRAAFAIALLIAETGCLRTSIVTLPDRTGFETMIVAIEGDGRVLVSAYPIGPMSALPAIAVDTQRDQLSVLLFDATMSTLHLPEGSLPPATRDPTRPLPNADRVFVARFEDGALAGWDQKMEISPALSMFRFADDSKPTTCDHFAETSSISLPNLGPNDLIVGLVPNDQTSILALTVDCKVYRVSTSSATLIRPGSATCDHPSSAFRRGNVVWVGYPNGSFGQLDLTKTPPEFAIPSPTTSTAVIVSVDGSSIDEPFELYAATIDGELLRSASSTSPLLWTSVLPRNPPVTLSRYSCGRHDVARLGQERAVIVGDGYVRIWTSGQSGESPNESVERGGVLESVTVAGDRVFAGGYYSVGAGAVFEREATTWHRVAWNGPMGFFGGVSWCLVIPWGTDILFAGPDQTVGIYRSDGTPIIHSVDNPTFGWKGRAELDGRIALATLRKTNISPSIHWISRCE